MLIKIVKSDFKYLYRFWESFEDFHGIICQDCKSKINYLRKEKENYVRCPNRECNFSTHILFEQDYFEEPTYGLSGSEIVLLKQSLQNCFEYEPDKFPDDEQKELDINSIEW